METVLLQTKTCCLKKPILSLFHKDNLYDKTGRKGTIYQKLRYAKRKLKEVDKSATKQQKTSIGNMASSDEGDDESFEENAANLIEFIQKCTLPLDTTKVKRAFEETIVVRRTMMLNLDKYKPLLDLLLLSPDLVNFYCTLKRSYWLFTYFFKIILHRFCSISIWDFHPSTAKPCH